MTDLITLEEFQSIKGVGKTGSDQRINALIPQVSALVRSYCNREFTPTNATQEIYTLWDEPFLLVQEIPLISVRSITVDGTAVDATKYFFTKHSGQIRYKNGCWDGGKTILVNYWGGYSSVSYDAEADPAQEFTDFTVEIPEEVKLATIDVVNYYLKEEYKENKVAQAYVIDTPGTSSLSRDTSFPDHIARVLDMYKLDDING